MSRLASLIAAARRGVARDGLPYKLTIILTRRCPTRCSFCSIWKTPSPEELEAREWDAVFASAPATVWANLSGGEIFQRQDLPEILDALTSRLPDLYLVDFPTTGYFPEQTLRACEQLVRAGVRRVLVTVSLDGPAPLHDRLRGREGAHEKACAALRMLREAHLPRVKAFFGHTLFPENRGRIGEMIEEATDLVPGLVARDFHFNVGMQSGHYYNNLGTAARPEMQAWEELQPFARRGLSPVSFLERAYQRRIPQYLANGRSPVPCSALKSSVFIDPQGVVYPCSIYSRPLGSLRQAGYDLGTLLRAEEAQSARRAVVADTCPGCWTPCEAYQSLFSHWFQRGTKRGSATRALEIAERPSPPGARRPGTS